ncbi:MAG TPA: tyrosine--tRNA ligase [Candidatus Thermoplasmatota archaeon]|nr:tyrosine--tRNA ligase [Candidatus Thermoplasmatota archaeon]
MDVEERLQLIREVGEEIVTEEELRALLAAKPRPVCYDGFEPSGRIHIAQGVLRAINVNKMTRAGCTFKMFVADWHAWANNKMGGDLERIQTVGKYFVEVWRAAGMDLENVKFVWASEFVTDEAYWKKVMNIARDSSLDRVLRTTQIMGRSDKDKLSASQILYPCMQAADIFHLEADITQLGMDQRKVNMLAREVAPKYGYAKPVVVSHHMLMGLQAPPTGEMDAAERATAMKMSKSNPDSAIFMTDAPADVERKMKNAYCPAKQAAENPVLEYFRYIVFQRHWLDPAAAKPGESPIVIERPEKFGGNATYDTYAALEADFVEGKVHPMDLKKAASRYVNEVLQPTRERFEKDEKARALKEQVDAWQVTR